MALLTTMKGLPLSYNKDMQEDKESLFDTADTVMMCLQVMTRLLDEISFKEPRLKETVEKGYLVATDLADYLVHKGSTFRDAHEVVGKMVRFAIDQEQELQDLTLDQMKKFCRQIDQDVYPWLDPLFSPSRKDLPGGTAPERVKAAIEMAKAELKD
jgi:argininosuccinate lyase